MISSKELFSCFSDQDDEDNNFFDMSKANLFSNL